MLKKLFKVMSLFVLVAVLSCNLGVSSVKAETINDSHITTSVNGQIVDLYIRYMENMNALEKQTFMEIDAEYNSYIKEINNYNNSNREGGKGKISLKLIKKTSFLKLNNIYSTRIDASNRLMFQFKGDILNVILSYNQFDMMGLDIVEIINHYYLLAENNSINNKIDKGINETKKNMKTIMLENID